MSTPDFIAIADELLVAYDARVNSQEQEVGAIPVGLTGTRNSPLFSFIPASETDVNEVFALFDEIDKWLESQLPHAMA